MENSTALSTWLKLNKLSINVEKTKAIMFHNPQKLVQYPNLFIDGKKMNLLIKLNILELKLIRIYTGNYI
jgi:hypothetical protein